MRSATPLIPVLVPVVLVGLGIAIGLGIGSWGHTGPGDEGTATETSTQDLRATVSVATAVAGPIDRELRATGVVRAVPGAEQVLCAPASTTVTAVLAAAGAEVHRGDVLVRFAAEPIDAAIAAARSELAAATAEATTFASTERQTRTDELLAAATAVEAELELATARARDLQALTADGLVAERTLTEARAAVDRLGRDRELAALRLRTWRDSGAEQQEQRLLAAVAAARERLAQATTAGAADVLAPADGTVLTVAVRPGDVPALGAEVARLLSGSGRVVDLAIPATAFEQLRLGMPVVLHAADGPHPGAIQSLPRQADPTTGMMRAVVAVEAGAAPPLPLDAAVNAAVQLEHLDAAVLVPPAAVVRDGDHLIVARVDADGTAHHVEVEIRAKSATAWAVAGDLAAGDTVVTGGAYNLPDGAGVVVAPPGEGDR